MIAAAVASPTSGSSAQLGASQEERLMRRLGVGEQQRALAEVVQQQRRQHQREPGDPNRPFPEVPHVRVQRLTTRDDEEHGAEHGKAVPAVRAKERDGVPRVDGRQH